MTKIAEGNIRNHPKDVLILANLEVRFKDFPDTAEKAFLRTAAIIEQRTEYGRLIPQWVRDVNEDKQYRDSETIGYHYYTYKKPLPFLNESQIENFPALVYFIAQTPTYFSGNITSRQSVSRWIVALDHIKVEMPRTHSALDELISSSSNCSERFLVFISNERRCPLQYWNNVARCPQCRNPNPHYNSET
ncbi:hypothetical protein ANCCEY_13666 [Ancylostoma ceylanicum]|uniref:Uncharacterized protein n=1 Tax=Ancylostoma ceylanicum TaxID=53326 RepID=A0A0D6L6F5_9BILA|nr:hypothetical protein ANCCEY_13666 [Ancylostoma ceylanicum]